MSHLESAHVGHGVPETEARRGTVRMKVTSENREKRQRESYAEECRVWAHENREAIASLKAKLFAIGGDKISPQPCPFVSEIASHGVLVELPVKLRQMDGNRCHHNVASLWEQRKKHSRLKAIATGYALSEDGMWCWHTLGLAAAHILETTVVRLQYFGIPMDAEDADAFAAGFLCQTETEFKLEQLKQLQQV
jgi:hypothetical protein